MFRSGAATVEKDARLHPHLCDSIYQSTAGWPEERYLNFLSSTQLRSEGRKERILAENRSPFKAHPGDKGDGERETCQSRDEIRGEHAQVETEEFSSRYMPHTSRRSLSRRTILTCSPTQAAPTKARPPHSHRARYYKFNRR